MLLRHDEPNATQSCWNEHFEDFSLRSVANHGPIRRWFEEYIPHTSEWERPDSPKRAFEIGCFPGRFLEAFGELGYELSGVDTTPRIVRDMMYRLSEKGFQLGHFAIGDFFAMSGQQQYDIVASFGFVQRYSDWRNTIQQHCALVAEGGYLVVSTPNPPGRRTPRATPEAWASMVQELDFEILFSGPFGGISLWLDSEPKHILQRPVLGSTKPNEAVSAPFNGLIARRHQTSA